MTIFLRNIGALLAGCLTTAALVLVSASPMSALAAANHRSPESYLGFYMIIVVPLAFFAGGLISGWCSRLRSRSGLLEAAAFSPGLYWGAPLVLRNAFDASSSYKGVTEATMLSGLLMILLSALGFRLAGKRRQRLRGDPPQ